MKTIFKILLVSLAFQNINAQQGILDTSFGSNGIQKASKLMYYNGDGNPRGTVKVLFNNTGSAIYLGNDLVNGGILPVINSTNGALNSNKVWNKRTIVKDGIIGANNKLYSTGFTEKEDNNKAIFVATGVNDLDIAAGNALNYDGKIVFDTKEADEEGIAIKLQSDNKIVVLGYSGTKGILIRYNTDGYLDRSFNEKGFYTFQIAQNIKPTSLAIQTDGKILVAGNCTNNNNTDFFITRINTNGTIDTSFGTNGVVIKDVNNHDNTGNGMLLTNDGSIYICGKSYTLGGDFGIESQYSYNFSVLKFNSNGSLATTSSNGILPGAFIKSLSFYQQYSNPATIVPDDEEVKCMAYDNINERIYIYGYANKKSYDNSYNIITRKTGLWSFCFSLDNSFTLQNATSFQFPANYTDFETEIVSATIKPSDMVLGSATTKVYALVKYNNCLLNQSTFISIPSNSPNTFPTSCNNNTVNLVFSRLVKTNNGFYGLISIGNDVYDLYKLDTNFIVDANFGINGKISNVKNFKIDNDSKLICTHYTTVSGIGIKTLLTRYTADGQTDDTFGTLGTVTSQYLMDTFGINVTSDNKYIVALYKTNASNQNPQIILQKIDNTGEIDTSFNSSNLMNASISTTNPSLKSSEEIVDDNLGNLYTIAYQQDVFSVQNQIITLSKINANGVLDATFGTNGFVNLVPFFNEPTNKLNLVKLNNGKLLAYSDKRMIQINTNGTLDTTFGNGGYIDGTTILADFNFSKVITNGTDYFIGGYRTNGGDNSTLIKMNNLGTIDTSFATNGIYIDSDPNFLNVSAGLRNMYFDSLTKIVFYGGGIPIKRIQ